MENIRLFIEEKKKIIDSFHSENKELRQNLEKILKTEFVYALSSIEGGSLSRAETAQVIETEQAVGGKSLEQQNQVLLYAKTVDWLMHSKIASKNDISEQQIISLHQLKFLINNTETEMLRYTFKVPYVLTEYIEWLHQQNDDILDTAVDAGVKLLQSKVFDEHSARTALLVTNMLLLQAEYPLIFVEEGDGEKWHEAAKKIERSGSSDEFVELMYVAIDRSLDVSLKFLQQKAGGGEDTWLKIGQLAKLTNESIPTIRHWTKAGLLQVVGYSQGGYQLYSPRMGEVVIKIRQLQREERLSVKEIEEKIK